MFKSFSDSIRSLWQSNTTETDQPSGEKRKRPPDDVDLDDSDVEIVSVKKPRQGNANSTSGLLSFLTVPMNKMSDWVRKKTVGQEHIFIQPAPRRTPQDRGAGEGQEQRRTRGSVHPSASNGPLTHIQSDSQLPRPPLHNHSGACENGVNGDVDIVAVHPGPCVRSPSSRHSSGSSVRQGRGRRTSVQQCFQLKEKEVYRKLLQQYTSIALGCDGDRQQTGAVQTTSIHNGHTHRTPGMSPLSTSSSPALPSSSPLPSSDSFFSSRPQRHSARAGPHVRPNHFSQQRPLSPSDGMGERCTGLALPGGERLAALRRCARGQQQQPLHGLSPAPVRARPHRGNSYLDEAEAEQVNMSSPSEDSDPDVIIVEDMNGSTSGRSPSLQFLSSQYLDEDWIDRLNRKYALAERQRQQLIEETELKKKLLEEKREERLGSLDKRLRQQMTLFDDEVEVIEELPWLEVEQESPLPELTDAMQREIDSALDGGPPHQVLSEGFRLQLRHVDIATLGGLNWLNDEVINFYMNMLMERGQQEGFSRTYAFNTFFYPKLMSGGHDAVKRWTRRMDVFSHHYLVIPVHLGVHWCLCVVFMKEKVIRYYDSMGGNNNQCLNAVRQYLYDESVQKRNIRLDLSEWSTETVKDIPQQMNGSDCGMFSCMYAESLTRGANITFTQKDMPYFRRRMVYELLKKQFL